MTRTIRKSLALHLLPGLLLLISLSSRYGHAQTPIDTTKTVLPDSVERLLYPWRPTFKVPDRYGDGLSNYTSVSPFFLKDGVSFKRNLVLDTGMRYSISEQMGKTNFRTPTFMSFEEYNQLTTKQATREYFKARSKSLDGESAISSRNLIPKLHLSPILDRIFGGSYVELVPKGMLTLDFGGSFQKIQNPAIGLRQQRNGGFEFDQQINLSVTGKVGEKLKVSTNFDNNNSFDFQNQMKVEYTGFKEDIIKKLEIGNVGLPLNNSLIYGAQNLFGIKAQMQFGKLYVTSIVTNQRGRQSTINVAGSPNGTSQGRPFEIVGSNYDENRHFFLGQFFRDNFEGWLGTLPQITSGVNITRVEVYILNRNNDTQTIRNLVGFMDLGESGKIYNKLKWSLAGGATNNSATANTNNTLWDFLTGLSPTQRSGETISNFLSGEGLTAGVDFERITSARKLAPTEYTVNKELGYISLQRKLQNDELLAVAYEYTYNGRPYKVGELSEDYTNLDETQTIFLKLLRPQKIAIKDRAGKILPTWNLMMKNIYNLNVTQLSRENFQLRVIYRDDKTGIDNPQLQEGDISRTKQLVQVFGLDRLNPYNDPQPDGNFDFVERITVNPETGLIIFPYLEPFNTPLRNLFKLEGNSNTRDFLTQKYVYDTLYRTTKAEAELVATKNKFYLTGSFKAGSGKEIIIQGFNITQGSVKVFAGGTPLREGTDYVVDYTFGKVTILNDGILSSGKDISVTYEQQDAFSFQNRSLLGSRFDYKLSDNFDVGATVLYYNERPIISRNAIGTEPARNLQYGVDFNFKKDSRLLTKMVDALPFIQTKEPSTLSVSAEFAQLLPGTSNIVNGEGTSFIDDFENTATPFSLQSVGSWRLASVPKREIRFDPSPGFANDNVEAGYLRAKLAWYQIDNLWYRQGGQFKPDYLGTDEVNRNVYTAMIQQQEIFPGRDNQIGNFPEPIFDIAYYPSERGPYNYRTTDLNADGSLRFPERNWAGITTAIRNEVDWDKSNIEYVEFWMLDPFVDNPNSFIDDGINPPRPNTTGGQMIFHMGSISEDVMRDGKHAFENGLPADGNLATNVTQNNWGYVTNAQFVNAAFDASAQSRSNQDVGLDGANDGVETTKFKPFLESLKTDGVLNGEAIESIEQDPSSDNFNYFLGGTLDSKRAGLLERYKNYNGQENNSPVSKSTDLFPRSNYTTPDNEDINADNTLTDLEDYYSYSINLQPGQLEVGKKYIVDKIQGAQHGEFWYLFRIPVRQFEEKFGDISGFKSIRYIRTILTGFKEPVVLRLANFRAVGNRWRRYTGNLEDARFGEPIEPNLDNFSVSVVNIEEHSGFSSTKPPYKEPLRRDRDNTSTVERRLNEQAVQICANDLLDGDGRAIYKNVSFDFFNYGRIKMFLSAYGQNVQSDDLTAFIRLGTDFDENYYEIELPLKIIDPLNADVQAGKVKAIWPEENEIDLALNDLYALKAQRDRANYSLDQLFPETGPRLVDGRHGIRILGRPDLSQVRLIMIGIRNKATPDKRSFSLCMWANELRLTDFDRTAGWALNTVASAKLADLGTINGSYKHISFGYGGVQSKIYERTRGETNAFDVSVNMNIDKLLPKWTGLKIPVYASIERTIVNPKYDPANPDMRLAAALKGRDDKDDYLKIIQDVSTRRSLNFTNVKRVKLDPKAKQHIWDIENFSFSYAYTEATKTNFNLQENTQRNYRGGINWSYSSKFKGLEPFKEAKWAKAKSLVLLREFSFNPMPKSINLRADLDRSFNKIVYRNASTDALSSLPNYQKYFVFNRNYTAKWDLFKLLSLDYNARVVAVIDEPDGDLDNDSLRQVVIDNLKKGGRTKSFDQNIIANYSFPFDKVPALNFLGGDYRHNVSYSWKAGPLEKIDSLKLGNMIQNSSEGSLSGKLDFVKLYNKIKFLKGINTPKRPLTAAEKARQEKAKPKADTVKKPPELKLLKGILRTMMAVRNINGTYTITRGTAMAGFNPTPKYIGLDAQLDAPGWGFILGNQDPDIRFKAAENGWLTPNPRLTAPFTQMSTRDLSLKANIEPAPDLRISVDAKKNTVGNYQEIFRFDVDNGQYESLSPSLSGSYKISTMAINTAFKFKDHTDKNSETFKTFEKNIAIIHSRFTAITGNEYDTKSQDVLIPAFLAAYSGKNAGNAKLTPFPAVPLPNWRLDYTGLQKLEIFKDVFQSITLSHGYSANYSVVNFTNSLEYTDVGVNIPLEKYNSSTFGNVLNSKNNPVPVYIISQVMISEQFQPLIGINVRTQNKMTVRFDYKTKRDLALNISNSQITEVAGRDISGEVGLTKNNFTLPWRVQGRKVTIKNEITFRMNVTYSINQTIQRKIEDVSTVTNGNKNFQFRPNLSYVANQKLNLQFYYEFNRNEPLVTSAFPRSTTRFGIKLLFNLAQ